MHGATACLYYPLQNSSIEQWLVVVIITVYRRLCCHSISLYSRLQTNVLAKFVDTVCILFYTHAPHLILFDVSLY